MTQLRSRLERGEVAELFVVAVLSLMLVVGLVVDGGAKATAISEASSLAQQAARAGSQRLDSLPADGASASLDASTAAADARGYLSQAGANGTVTVIDPTTIEVTVTSTESTIFLGLVGINTVSGTRTARVDLIHGQTEVTTP
ncbi:hypothetical protein, partial [Brachybacterium kimchii]